MTQGTGEIGSLADFKEEAGVDDATALAEYTERLHAHRVELADSLGISLVELHQRGNEMVTDDSSEQRLNDILGPSL